MLLHTYISKVKLMGQMDLSFTGLSNQHQHQVWFSFLGNHSNLYSTMNGIYHINYTNGVQLVVQHCTSSILLRRTYPKILFFIHSICYNQWYDTILTISIPPMEYNNLFYIIAYCSRYKKYLKQDVRYPKTKILFFNASLICYNKW